MYSGLSIKAFRIITKLKTSLISFTFLWFPFCLGIVPVRNGSSVRQLISSSHTHFTTSQHHSTFSLACEAYSNHVMKIFRHTS